VAFFFFLGLAIFSAAQIILDWREYDASKNEYNRLREMYEPPLSPQRAAFTEAVADTPPVPLSSVPETAAETETKEEAPPAPPREPAEINQEYVGWLKINGAVISYPVARGADNEKYLRTSFEGRKSGLGAVFMDYRCAGAFADSYTIIYAHNAKNGAMFGSLVKYLDAAYLEEHREITVTLPDGRKETWRVFAARQSDIADPAYRLDFSGPESFAAFAASLGAPEGVSRIMTLSTCTSGGGNDERMLVHAAIME
jgi:sortase B